MFMGSVSNNFFTVADRLLSVETRDEWSAQLFTRVIADFCFLPVAYSENKPDGILRIWRTGTPPPVPAGLSGFEIADGYCYSSGEAIYLAVYDSLIIVHRRAAKLIELFIGETTRALRPMSLINSIIYAVQALLRRASVYPLHAAGLIEPQSNHGVLIIGDSGAGKSTLTIRLTAAGWRYLSDDLMTLIERNGHIIAQGLRRIFSLAAVSGLMSQELPRLEAALGKAVLADPTKHVIHPMILFPDSLAQACVPHRLLFPEVTAEETSRLIRLAPVEAMSRLIKHCPWSTYDTAIAPDYLSALGLLIKQSVAYRLIAGADLLREPQRAAMLLSSV
ncbi:MAG: hypothetical protein ABR577_11565 [Pyrinomonadaceae bacterium]